VVEQARGGAQQMGIAIARGAVQAGGRRMQQFVGQAMRELIEHIVRIASGRELFLRAGQQGVAGRVAACTQRLERVLSRAATPPRHELFDLQVDQGLGFAGGLLARAAVLADHLLEVVHGIQIHVVESRGLGLDIARHGEIEQEHRCVASNAYRALDRQSRKHRFATRGRADHDVGFREVPFEILQRQRDATEAMRELLRVFERAVGNEDPLGLGIDQVARGKLDGFASADQQHGRLIEPREHLLRKSYRRVRDRHRMRADAGIGAHPFGDRETMLEQPVEPGLERMRAARGLPGMLDLAEDLRLAEDERIEPGRDPEQMAHRSRIGVAVEVGIERRHAKVVVFS